MDDKYKDNNSLIFIKDRIKTGKCENINLENINSITALPFDETFTSVVLLDKKIWDEERNGITILLQDVKIDGIEKFGELKVHIEYNPEADFDYFTMESCICDGTLTFFTDLIRKISKKIMHMETYYKEVIPDDYMKNPFKYDVKYIVGDYVMATESESGDFRTKEKPWLQERFMVMLPIKFELIEK